ncbi:hypothetical protein T484DRAFT_1900311 [Baffinella frigidus]|nr:hypothetical protein T484DRAFT_1900311 [Cryptophyta sp. CCMP2293]
MPSLQGIVSELSDPAAGGSAVKSRSFDGRQKSSLARDGKGATDDWGGEVGNGQWENGMSEAAKASTGWDAGKSAVPKVTPRPSATPRGQRAAREATVALSSPVDQDGHILPNVTRIDRFDIAGTTSEFPKYDPV